MAIWDNLQCHNTRLPLEHTTILTPTSNTHALDELLEYLEANKLEKVSLSPSLHFPFVLRDSRNSGQFLFQCPSSWQWKHFPLPCSSLMVALGLTVGNGDLSN